MSEVNKPREFWIHPGVEAWQSDGVVMNPACKKDHHIHVIEISAFNKAVEALNEAVACWGDYAPNPNSKAGKALSNAKLTLKELRVEV